MQPGSPPAPPPSSPALPETLALPPGLSPEQAKFIREVHRVTVGLAKGIEREQAPIAMTALGNLLVSIAVERFQIPKDQLLQMMGQSYDHTVLALTQARAKAQKP